jgi:hypothetical protein
VHFDDGGHVLRNGIMKEVECGTEASRVAPNPQPK